MRLALVIARLIKQDFKTLVAWVFIFEVAFLFYGGAVNGEFSLRAAIVGAIVGTYFGLLSIADRARHGHEEGANNQLSKTDMHLLTGFSAIVGGSIIGAIFALPWLGFAAVVIALWIIGAARAYVERIIP